MFSGLSITIKDFTFRILEYSFDLLSTDEIGGGSFYQLSKKIVQMRELKALNLSISTFEHIDPKTIEPILKAISASTGLESLALNFSKYYFLKLVLNYLQR